MLRGEAVRGQRATRPPLFKPPCTGARPCRKETLMKGDSASAPALARILLAVPPLLMLWPPLKDNTARRETLFKSLLVKWLRPTSKQQNYVTQTFKEREYEREYENKICSTHPEDKIKEKQHIFYAFCAARHSHVARCASISSLSCPESVYCRGSHSSWQRSRFVLQKPLLYNQEWKPRRRTAHRAAAGGEEGWGTTRELI